MHAARSFLLLLMAALPAACAVDSLPSPAPSVSEQTEPRGMPTEPVTRTPASLAAIAGEWDIVEFDGYSPQRLDTDGQRHAFVDIRTTSLSFTIGCNYSGMPASIGADGVLVPGVPDDGMQTQMGCGPVREARDSAFFGFFRSRPQVALGSDGRLRLATGDRSLLLERADVRRLANGPPLAEITGTWRVVSFMSFRDGGHQGWGPMFAPGRVRIEPSTVSYSRCPDVAAPFRYTADFTLVQQSPAQLPSPSCAGVSPAATEVEPMLAALLRQSPHAERVPGGRYLLRSKDYAVVLTSETDYQREFGESAADWERRPG